MNARRLSGLFINCVEAQDSIYESGRMVYQCLLGSEKYSLDYVEITPDKVSVPTGHDFYFFNYHIKTMSWLDTKSIRELLPGVRMTMVLEVSPNDPFVFCSPDDFDAYCVLDPTLNMNRKNVFAFPRPLEVFNGGEDYEPKDVPVIGSFGFATTGKGFEHVVDAVNKEFDKAFVRINIPYAAYADEGGRYANRLAQMCRDRAKEGVEVIVTHDYMTKAELIEWCRQNTINCFLYDRNMPGLAATTDQAITSGRPLITSKNNTFRHIQKYIKPFPYQTLREAIEKTQPKVEEIKREWSPEKFRERFEEVLSNFQFGGGPGGGADKVELKVLPSAKGAAQSSLLYKLRCKIRAGDRLRSLNKKLWMKREFNQEPTASYSKFGEDVIVNSLLEEFSIKSISYLEVGGDKPVGGNTRLFYGRGFSGVLVEADTTPCEELRRDRPRDTVLSLGAGISEAIKGARATSPKRKVEEAPGTALLSLDYIISHHFTECPDFVSIDVQGWNLQILKTLDFEKYNPALFCVPGDEEVNAFFEGKGYFAFRAAGPNTIFVNRNLYDFYLYQKQNVNRQGNIRPETNSD